jgi:DNA-binding NtrC family response regulator
MRMGAACRLTRRGSISTAFVPAFTDAPAWVSPLRRPSSGARSDCLSEITRLFMRASISTCGRRHLQACERRYIESALRANRWRMAETATALDISRKNLWEKLRKLGIAGEEG